jgi:hypothetical protein
MSMVSRWPVLVTATLTSDELDAQQHLTPAAVERVFALARDAYLSQCRTLAGVEMEVATCDVQIGGATVLGTEVTIVAAVVEIYPESFTMRARIRASDAAGGTGDVAADAACTLTTSGTLPQACVDEFIALAHNAPHVA